MSEMMSHALKVHCVFEVKLQNKRKILLVLSFLLFCCGLKKEGGEMLKDTAFPVPFVSLRSQNKRVG